MKKLKLLTAAFLLGMTTLFASENIDNPNTEIRTQIVHLLDNITLEGEFEEEKIVKVNFTFTFNSQGEIVVLNVDSNRKDIKDYIRKNVNSKKLLNPGNQDEIYKMPITIKFNS